MSGQKIIEGLKEALEFAANGKPQDIPQDILSEAERLASSWFSVTYEPHQFAQLAEAIGRAILAAKAEERETCALLLEDVGIDIQDRFAAAEAIRNRGNVNTVRKSENQEG